jgi:hypothetical protein
MLSDIRRQIEAAHANDNATTEPDNTPARQAGPSELGKVAPVVGVQTTHHFEVGDGPRGAWRVRIRTFTTAEWEALGKGEMERWSAHYIAPDVILACRLLAPGERVRSHDEPDAVDLGLTKGFRDRLESWLLEQPDIQQVEATLSKNAQVELRTWIEHPEYGPVGVELSARLAP